MSSAAGGRRRSSGTKVTASEPKVTVGAQGGACRTQGDSSRRGARRVLRGRSHLVPLERSAKARKSAGKREGHSGTKRRLVRQVRASSSGDRQPIAGCPNRREDHRA